MGGQTGIAREGGFLCVPPTEVNWDSGASCLLVPRWALQTPIILQTLRPMSFVGPAWDERWVGWAWGHVISRCPGFPSACPPAAAAPWEMRRGRGSRLLEQSYPELRPVGAEGHQPRVCPACQAPAHPQWLLCFSACLWAAVVRLSEGLGSRCHPTPEL